MFCCDQTPRFSASLGPKMSIFISSPRDTGKPLIPKIVSVTGKMANEWSKVCTITYPIVEGVTGLTGGIIWSSQVTTTSSKLRGTWSKTPPKNEKNMAT